MNAPTRRFHVSAVWEDNQVIPILKNVSPTSYTHTVPWIRNVVLWILGGLFNTPESTTLFASANKIHAFVSDTPLYGHGVLLGPALPVDVSHFYVHLTDTRLKPQPSTVWQVNRDLASQPTTTRGIAQTRSLYHCIFLNIPSHGENNTHEVAHIIATACSPAAFKSFCAALDDLGVEIPPMQDPHSEFNSAWVCKFAHGHLHREKLSVYIPSMTLSPSGQITATTLEVHDVRDSFEVLYDTRCQNQMLVHPAVVPINSARATGTTGKYVETRCTRACPPRFTPPGLHVHSG
ncbi:hypothetical protein B0H19DRAFT_636512 [Mycena capillaripes]|nr:hypothetical protein B0H19DRAFT_636512 [Mycena capillaripes]